MPVGPDVGPVLLVNEVRLHLGHGQVDLLSVNESNTGAKPEGITLDSGYHLVLADPGILAS